MCSSSEAAADGRRCQNDLCAEAGPENRLAEGTNGSQAWHTGEQKRALCGRAEGGGLRLCYIAGTAKRLQEALYDGSMGWRDTRGQPRQTHRRRHSCDGDDSKAPWDLVSLVMVIPTRRRSSRDGVQMVAVLASLASLAFAASGPPRQRQHQTRSPKRPAGGHCPTL